jgi:transcriptional regulator with XRE-family HTH domain
MTNLQEYRKKSGLSQSKLAKQAGVNVRTLQDYEQGRKQLGQATAATVLRIAKVLGVTVEDLIK